MRMSALCYIKKEEESESKEEESESEEEESLKGMAHPERFELPIF